MPHFRRTPSSGHRIRLGGEFHRIYTPPPARIGQASFVSKTWEVLTFTQVVAAALFATQITVHFRFHTLLLVAFAFVCHTGCVQRRLTIRSNPPGAMVYVDDQPIGNSPVSTPFTYYGTRKIRLEKDGFETVKVEQNFNPPWYEIPPLDFFSENLGMTERRDERVVDFQLYPQAIVPTDRLRARAEQLRSSIQQGVVTPMFQSPP